MSERTFKVGRELMSGDDVEAWQRTLNAEVRRWGAREPIVKADGKYGVATRAATSTVLRGLGIAQEAMAKGVTPALRVKVRNRRLSAAEKWRFARRASVRRREAAEVDGLGVAAPFVKVLTDSWGWHPGVHDGLDLITPADAVLHSMTAGVVVRSDASGWWGLGAPADPELRAKGDGIIIVRCTVDTGPFKKGLMICYGHAEKSRVHVGEHVKAGQRLGSAGFANAWHVHLMVNDGSRKRDDGTVLGVGDRDPRPFYDYARKHGT